MPLTNAERQARFRDRQRTAIEDLILMTRKNIREWQRTLALYEGGMRFLWSNVDVTQDRVASLHRMIRENFALIEQHDPAGAARDGDLELGKIAPATARELVRGHLVTYILDSAGCAGELRLFETENQARAFAAASPERLVGVIGDESWSVRPI